MIFMFWVPNVSFMKVTSSFDSRFVGFRTVCHYLERVKNNPADKSRSLGGKGGKVSCKPPVFRAVSHPSLEFQNCAKSGMFIMWGC